MDTLDCCFLARIDALRERKRGRRRERERERVHWERTEVHWTEGKVYRKMELFLTVEGTDGVGILRQRNAIHKIPKFSHVVSHGKREKTHFRSRATCYVASFPAHLSAPHTEMAFPSTISFATFPFVFTRYRSPQHPSFAIFEFVYGVVRLDEKTRKLFLPRFTRNQNSNFRLRYLSLQIIST